MDETILFPSPNWFQPSVLAVSCDGWIFYGGPNKSLCALEPLPGSVSVIGNQQSYRAHVMNRVHGEKMLCVDISPEWPQKKAILTGAADGTVKQWSIERSLQTTTFKTTHNHEVHQLEREEAVGVGYFKEGYAVTVGSLGRIVKWDLTSNVVKTYSKVITKFRVVCIACSPHVHLNVAIGTKQGVVFVVDLTGAARVLYKVRGQDDEILKVSWCPQFEVMMKKSLKESDKRSAATVRMEKIRNEPECPEKMKELNERVNREVTDQPVLVNDKLEPICKETEVGEAVEKTNEELEEPYISNEPEVANEQAGDSNKVLEDFKKEEEEPAHDILESLEGKNKDSLSDNEGKDESGIGKTLPDDSFDQSTVVEEDDMFDIYTDHAADEFGHKKYQPEEIVVRISSEEEKTEYLDDCMKLKEEILRRKQESEVTVTSLVEAFSKTHVDTEEERSDVASPNTGGEVSVSQSVQIKEAKAEKELESSQVCKHLLATIGKHGSVKIWSKAGKLVSSCVVLMGTTVGKNNKNQKFVTNPATMLWYKPNVLLLVDGKSQLLQCDPLKIDCRNKIEFSIVHSLHKRGLYLIASDAPRVQLPTDADKDWTIWSTAQDRTLISYSLKTKKAAIYNTCGGFAYTIMPCPYDPRKMSLSVGDGAVRVWEADTSEDDDTKLSTGTVTTFWQKVQGKVLNTAWHPTRENLLAFSTAESRVGLIDTSGKGDKPARVLVPSLTGGIYTLCWGEGNDLYACAGGEAVVYRADKPEEAPTAITVELEGQSWKISTFHWYSHAAVCGTSAGAVAVLTPSWPHHLIAVNFVFTRMIHMVDWHPTQTSNSSEESPYKNLMAVCSLDRSNAVVILEFGDKDDGTKQLTVWKTLTGHKNSVSQVAWNPHIEELLLSTSQDATIRVWNIVSGDCSHVFDGHVSSSLGASWLSFPQLGTRVLSGGGDCCVRLWDIHDYPASAYDENKNAWKKKKRNDKKKVAEMENEENGTEDIAPETNAPEEDVVESNGATILDKQLRTSKKFLMPSIYRQMIGCKVSGLRRMLKKHIEKTNAEANGDGNAEANGTKEAPMEYDIDYIKLFGTMNELNEILDAEMERHEDTGNLEAWMVLSVFRGHIDTMIQFATQRNLLDPYLLSITPSVSLKYWKDVSQLYLSQIDRFVAKGEDLKLYETRTYGGPVYRKVVTLLSQHDLKGAVSVLIEARLYMEAYVLCRTRYVDSIAEETLKQWAHHSYLNGRWNTAAACYITVGDLSQAAATLGKSPDEDSLSLAADIAKLVGQNTYADHIEGKVELIKSKETKEIPQLKDLLSKADVLLNATQKGENTKTAIDDIESKMENVSIEGNTVDNTREEKNGAQLNKEGDENVETEVKE